MRVIKENEDNAAEIACQFLLKGKVISFATDTVYATAVDASDFNAVERLYSLKNRDQKKPIAIFLKDLDEAKKLFYFDFLAQKIAEEFLPGALTLVLKTKSEAGNILASNLNKNFDQFLGFRIVESFFLKKLFEKYRGILAVTSANLSGQQPAKNANEVQKYLPDLDLVIDGGNCNGRPSSVIKISNNHLTILRHGTISESMNLANYENL